jgi:hypothetical protein
MMMAPAARSVATICWLGAGTPTEMIGLGGGKGKGTRTYGGVALGWSVRPLRVSDRAVETFDVD